MVGLSLRLPEGPEKPTASDATGFARRIEKLPVPDGRYAHLQIAADGALLLIEQPSELTFAGKPRLRRFDAASRKLEDLAEGVRGFEVSADGKTLLYRSRELVEPARRGSKPVARPGRSTPPGSRSQTNPREEWRQMFVEAWRNQRDFFYDEALHGVDWKAIRARYEAYLPDLRYRSDLTFVHRHLVGELVNSHISVEGPPAKVEKTPGGLLGADYEIVADRYRVKRIVAGAYWNGEASPLAAPGVDVEAGHYILEVEGKELRHPISIDSLLWAGRASPSPSGSTGRRASRARGW